MEKYRLWYKAYRGEMNQALKHTDEKIKKQSTNDVIQIYKQEFYGASGFEESKRNREEEFYPEALALYNIVYDYAIHKNKVGYCGFVWKVSGPVLCEFYLKKKKEKPIMASASTLKKIFG